VKRLAILLLIVAACRPREAPHRANVPAPKPSATTSTTTPPPSRVAVPKPRAVSTPAKCAGDGSYEQAVDCFRMSSGFRFRVTSPAVTARGALERPRIGQERVTVGDWTAVASPGGIVWTRGGKPAAPSPELERLYQRLTLYLDPQKKEGAPQLVDAHGDTNHYHFTDANSGEAYDVFVAKGDGRIVELRAGKTEIAIQ
jgi:hypothetical protein